MTPATLTPKQLKSIDRTLSGGTWIITFGAVLFSDLTVTPLVREVTPEGWRWTAPILPIVVDAAVVIVIRLDATVARLGQSAGHWPLILRWLTGLMTLALNVAGSALKQDWVGTAVHAVAPLLLIVTAEASLAYRRALTRALDAQELEQRERAEATRRERQEREEAARRERREREEAARRESEEAARREREERERERELEERRAREQRAHEVEMAERQAAAEAAREREAREHEARVARERDERQAREREAARREREAREREQQTRREVASVSTPAAPASAAVSTPTAAVSTPEKLPEHEALTVIEQGVRDGMSTRQLAAATGWSTGWVTTRAKEVRVPA